MERGRHGAAASKAHCKCAVNSTDYSASIGTQSVHFHPAKSAIRVCNNEQKKTNDERSAAASVEISINLINARMALRNIIAFRTHLHIAEALRARVCARIKRVRTQLLCRHQIE